MAIPAGESTLFRERFWTSRRPYLWLLLITEALVTLVIVVGSPSLTSAVVGYALATGVPVIIAIWAELGARQVWFVVGERTLKLGRAKPIPASAVTGFAPVSGAADIDALRKRLRGDADLFNMQSRPQLKGILVPPGATEAVLVFVEAGALPFRIFLIGTRRQPELLAALEQATHRAPDDIEALRLTQESTALGSPHGSPRHT